MIFVFVSALSHNPVPWIDTFGFIQLDVERCEVIRIIRNVVSRSTGWIQFNWWIHKNWLSWFLHTSDWCLNTYDLRKHKILTSMTHLHSILPSIASSWNVLCSSVRFHQHVPYYTTLILSFPPVSICVKGWALHIPHCYVYRHGHLPQFHKTSEIIEFVVCDDDWAKRSTSHSTDACFLENYPPTLNTSNVWVYTITWIWLTKRSLVFHRKRHNDENSGYDPSGISSFSILITNLSLE